MAESMDSVLIISLPEKDNLQLYQNYRIIRLLSHQSKVIMKVILNRLNAQPGEIIERFRAGGSVTKISASVKSAFNITRICTMSS